MKQPISRSPGSSLPWLIRRSGRIAAGIIAAAIADFEVDVRGIAHELVI